MPAANGGSVDLVTERSLSPYIRDTVLREARSRVQSADGLEVHPVERAAAERLLTVIGEAAKNVSPAFRALHPEIPWRGMAGLRDRLVHHSFGVAYEAVWATLTEDLPSVEAQVGAVVETAAT